VTTHPATDTPQQAHPEAGSHTVAYVGGYPDLPNPGGGGVSVVRVSAAGDELVLVDKTDEPALAGYLAHAPSLGTLYAVDERKNDGRGPVEPAAAVHAFAVEPGGHLRPLNALPAPGPRPTYVSVDQTRRRLVTANHGDFDHVEHVVRLADGGWAVEYLYDDSTVLLYSLADDGSLDALLDVHARAGHGPDPNSSPQAGGHAQASAHAHCAVLDPSGRYVLVCDKGTDEVVVLQATDRLQVVSTLRLPPQTGPRHLVFDPAGDLAYLTLELSSELASVRLDRDTGTLELLHRISTVDDGHTGLNEPADLQLHPAGDLVYVNNRGEDSLAWFRTTADGRLTRLGHVILAPSIHPGLAARCLAIHPDGRFLLMADRPANLLRSFAVDPADGTLTPLTDLEVVNPASVLIVKLTG
jgi:6-phosphogluconolactonase